MEEITTISKLEIAELLYNFTKVANRSMFKPDKSFLDIAKECDVVEGVSNAGERYYHLMSETYMIYLMRKYFVSMYDVAFPYLKEKDIDKVKVPDSIFVNPADARFFSKKQVIKYIRNALCHNNNENNDIYKLIVKDGRIQFEINLRQVQPRPFHVRLDNGQLSQIALSLFDAPKTDAVIVKKNKQLDFNSGDVVSLVLNELYYRHVYAKLTEEEKLNGSLETIIDNAVAKTEYKDIKFTESQAQKIKEDVDFVKNYGLDANLFISYIVKNVMPVFTAKRENLEKVMTLVSAFFVDPKSSFIDFQLDIEKFLNGEESEVSRIKKNYKNEYELLYACNWDKDSIMAGVSSIMFEYMFSTLITDETLLINGEEVSVEKIRNSLIHSRWFLGENGKMCLLDWQNGDKNEMDINWSKEIHCSDLTRVVCAYLERKMEEEKEKGDTE